MKVSKNWLQEFLKIEINMKDLAKQFSLKSQEVSSVEKLTDATKIVVGKIISKEKHPNADKLNVCQVDVGETLQIVCGAKNVEVGQKVIVALVGAVLPGNFKIKKAKLRSVESNGMICSLVELGIDKKCCYSEGIEVLPDYFEIGKNPLELLGLIDEVMELDLTPNRPDLMSMIGVAYETKAILNIEAIYLPEPKFKEIKEKIDLEIKIDTINCSNYYAKMIKNVKIGESPNWLKAKLIASGVRPINNVVDISNYVMLELGQPLHTFDYDKIGSKEIVIRQATEGEEITTLDGIKRNLLISDVVITNGEKPIAIAGVMGGLTTAVDDSTKTILLESAMFDQVSVRITSKRLELRSDASVRFEKGIDVQITNFALNRATQLLQELAGGEVVKGTEFIENNNFSGEEIKIDLNYINEYIGCKLTVEEIENIFDLLSFDYQTTDNLFKVFVPTRRRGVSVRQDLIEEIVRIYGYDKVPITLPKTQIREEISLNTYKKNFIGKLMTGLGLDEVITYSLVNEKNIYDFTLQKENYVIVSKPMSLDKAVMRHTPLNGIIKSIKYNLARKNNDLRFFEIGHKYTEGEPLILSGTLTGVIDKTLWKKTYEEIDFYYVKGLIETVLKKDKKKFSFVKPEKTNENFHPGQTAYIYQEEQLVGFIAKLHPKYQFENSLKDTFIFELFLDKLFEDIEQIKFKKLQKYPVVERDLAIVIDRDIEASCVADLIEKTGKPLLLKLEIFDIYQGENIPENKKSIAFKLIFGDKEKTLDSEIVSQKIEVIVKEIKKRLNGKLRD